MPKSTQFSPLKVSKNKEKNLEIVLTNGRQMMRKINERFRHLVPSSGKRRKTGNNEKNKEVEKRTEEKEVTKLHQGISRMNK